MFILFPKLFDWAQDQNASVFSQYSIAIGRVVWNLKFRNSLPDHVAPDLLELHSIRQNMAMALDKDKITWS